MHEQTDKRARSGLVAITSTGTSVLKYVEWLKPRIEAMGHEVVGFHTPAGQGFALEQLIKEGAIMAVLDLCPVDLTNLTYPFLTAVPKRFDRAGEQGITQIVAPGGVDFFAYTGPMDALPTRFKKRRRHKHSQMSGVVERSPDETRQTAKLMAEKLNKAKGIRVVIIPMLGFSVWDKPGGMFFDPERGNNFSEALKARLRPGINVLEVKAHINDELFAEVVLNAFTSSMTKDMR